MPIKIPTLDDRRYQDLLDEALARIPVHNPEWTNFNKSDPGVTLVEVFSFLTENLFYRANQVPERNRRKFLSLLGMPLQSATPARGLVTFSNERGPLVTFTLNGGIEVRAGQIPFRTGLGLDVLPIEARVYYKRRLPNLTSSQKEYYRQLYASFFPDDTVNLDTIQLYETAAMPEPSPASTGLDLGSADVVDGLWLALLVRASEKDPDALQKTREAIAGKTLNLGVAPYLSDAERLLNPVGQNASSQASRLAFEIPAGGLLPASRQPTYRALPAEASQDVLATPGIIQVMLPEVAALEMWQNLDPLELGVGDFPASPGRYQPEQPPDYLAAYQRPPRRPGGHLLAGHQCRSRFTGRDHYERTPAVGQRRTGPNCHAQPHPGHSGIGQTEGERREWHRSLE